MNTDLVLYAGLLGDIKSRIRQAQNRAALAVNAELVRLYWDVGGLILARQQLEGWGAAVIPRLSRDLHNELPELKGFSERNIGYMIRFAREYGASAILQQPVAKTASKKKLPQPVAKIASMELLWNTSPVPRLPVSPGPSTCLLLTFLSASRFPCHGFNGHCFSSSRIAASRESHTRCSAARCASGPLPCLTAFTSRCQLPTDCSRRSGVDRPRRE